MTLLALAAALTLSASPQAAEPSSAPAPAVLTAPAASTPALQLGTPRARLEAAVARLLRGEVLDAALELEALAADPTAGELGPAAVELARLARELERRGGLALRPPGSAPGTPAAQAGIPLARDKSGRAELALWQTLYGASVGGQLAALADVKDPAPAVALTLLGSASGLAISLIATRDGGMSTGRADAINSATTWGTFNGVLIGLLGGADGRALVGASLIGGLGGLAITAGATTTSAPTAGDVSLVNSGGLWGTAAGGLLLAASGGSGTTTVSGVLLAAGDAGLATGALLARRYQLSRSHVLVIDAGGALGLLAGLAVPTMLNAKGSEAYGVSGLVGLTAGLGIAAGMTRDWEAEQGEAHAAATFAPAAIRLAGGGTAYGLAGRF